MNQNPYRKKILGYMIQPELKGIQKIQIPIRKDYSALGQIYTITTQYLPQENFDLNN